MKKPRKWKHKLNLSGHEKLKAESSLCRRSFYQFVKRGWKHFFPEEFIDGRHIEVLCDEAQAIVTGQSEYDAAIINIPPGHAKSRIFSVLLPAWCIGPRGMLKAWLCASLAAKLSIRDSDACRDVVRSEWFQERWPIEFKGSQDAKTSWEMETGAKRDTTSTDARATGLRAHVRLLDDPQDLSSTPAKMESANDWIRTAWGSRDNFGNEPQKDFLIQQRCGDNDATRMLLDLHPKKWKHIWFPVEFDPDDACPCDWRTEPGELLWPEAYSKMVPSGDPKEWVVNKKREVGPRNWECQYNQKPRPDGGTEFKSEWLQNRFEVLEVAKVERWLISVDASFKGELTSDWCVLGLHAKVGSHYNQVDVIRRKMDYPELKATLREYVLSWRARGVPVDTVLVEDKANGPALIADLHKEISGLVPFSPKDGKILRYRAISGILAALQFFLPSDTAHLLLPDGRKIPLAAAFWREVFIAELLSIPGGKHDDQADQLAQAVIYLESFAEPAADGGWMAPMIDVYTVERKQKWA